MRRLRRLSNRSGAFLVAPLRSRGFATQAELLRYLDVFRGPAAARREPAVSGFSVVYEASSEGELDEGSFFRLR